MPLDHRKLLAGDPPTTRLFLGLVRQWVRKFFRKRSQLDGVVQSAMTEMFDKLRRGDIPESDHAAFWALTCANNAVRRELTDLRKHQSVAYESHLHGEGTTDVSKALRLGHELRRVAALLDMCNQGTRQLLEARVHGSTYQEIADEFGVGEGAARKAVSRLRKQLAEQLSTRDKIDLLRRQLEQLDLSRHQSTRRSESSAGA